MTEIEPRQEQAMVPAGAQASELVLWAYEAKQAHQIALSLARTSFVPASLRGKPEDITAAILAGQELGLRPMATLRSMDVIQGTPALRAHAMRGLVQSRGHEVQLLESTETRCKMRGRRQGEQDWQMVTWTIDRATRLGLAGKEQWKKQPQSMLVARATGEICRLIASDVLHAMPYAAEELGDDLAENGAKPKRRTAQRKALPPVELPEPDLADPHRPINPAATPGSGKCDGNHAMPPCSAPECWHKDPPEDDPEPEVSPDE